MRSPAFLTWAPLLKTSEKNKVGVLSSPFGSSEFTESVQGTFYTVGEVFALVDRECHNEILSFLSS